MYTQSLPVLNSTVQNCSKSLMLSKYMRTSLAGLARNCPCSRANSISIITLACPKQQLWFKNQRPPPIKVYTFWYCHSDVSKALAVSPQQAIERHRICGWNRQSTYLDSTGTGTCICFFRSRWSWSRFSSSWSSSSVYRWIRMVYYAYACLALIRTTMRRRSIAIDIAFEFATYMLGRFMINWWPAFNSTILISLRHAH